MSAWNAEAMSKLFLSEAESADRHLSEVADKAKTNKSFAQIYDQHLARYYLYNYLHGRVFLYSRETLLKELRVLEQTRFTTPHGVYDAERFEKFRQHYISELINDLSAGQGTVQRP